MTTCVVVQVMERTDKLMMKAIVRYREDLDLENVIDFIQKKVKNDSARTQIVKDHRQNLDQNQQNLFW